MTTDKLTRSKERVQNFGEVFTPSPIVGAMHSMLPHVTWSDRTMVYLEPTCGNGQFLVLAVMEKMTHGLTSLEAANTVFGMDIMQDNIDEARKRVYGVLESETPQELRDDLKCIVVNNIFHVEDSPTFIAEGRWERKRFFQVDPTGHNQVMKQSKQERLRFKVKGLVL